MKILNLVYEQYSDITYKISKFPDGQQNVDIKGIRVGDQIDEWGKDLSHFIIQIKSRLNNWLDLELIVCAVKSLRELGIESIHLYVPYFLGSRSDRKFEEGGNNYLKDVICPIINSLNFKSVTVLDPHSDVLEACLNNFKKKSNIDLINWVLNNYVGDGEHFPLLISPDAGSNKKIYKLSEQIGYKGDIITCSKERDKDGKLTKCIVPLNNHWIDGKDIIIIDDICDGGNTFINIAKKIRDEEEKLEIENRKIYLIVTHGIFSNGVEDLSQYFNGIYCTNSYSDNNHLDKFVQQLNIF